MTTPWRLTLDASLLAHRDDPMCRYVQLATLGLDGRPANRTVVFRGFRPDSDDLIVTVDARSQKMAEIARSPFFEICWYFGRTREQYRLGGTARSINDSDRFLAGLRTDVWRSLADAVRIQFDWPSPGTDWQNHDAHVSAEIPDSSTPLTSFRLLLLTVERADYLNLLADPPLRQQLEIGQDGWTCRRVNP